MKKVFIISLLLISVFLVGSVEVYAQCTFYSCTGSYKCGGPVVANDWTECVDIHVYNDGYAELYGGWFYCELGGKSLLSSDRNFVGICTSMAGSLGAAIDLRGRAMTVNFYELTSGCMDELRCTLGGCTP